MAQTKILFRPTEMEQINRSIEDTQPWLNTVTQLAQKILLEVMQFRRIAGLKKSCATSICETCLQPHIGQVISAIEERRAITFVLPAFPGKSPNPAKVLGTLSDMAERCSLVFLDGLCERIKKLWLFRNCRGLSIF